MRRTEGAANLQAPRDLGFADASTMQLPYLVGVETCGGGPAQPLTVLPCMGQAGRAHVAAEFLFRTPRILPASSAAMVRPAVKKVPARRYTGNPLPNLVVYSLFWVGTISLLECGTPEWIRTTDLLLRRQCHKGVRTCFLWLTLAD